MPDLGLNKESRRLWKLLRVVAGAILVSEVIYLVACIVIARAVAPDGAFRGFVEARGNRVLELVPAALFILSLPAIGFAFRLKRSFKRRPLPAVRPAFWLKSFFKGREATAILGIPVAVPDTPEGRRVLRLFRATATSMYVATAPSIFGMFTFFITGDFIYLALFLGLSFVTKLFLFPRTAEIEEMIDAERMLRDL